MPDPTAPPPPAYWSETDTAVLQRLGTSEQGLSESDAATRVAEQKRRAPGRSEGASPIRLFLSQFANPIILMLLVSAGLSFGLSDATGGIIILVIVGISGALGFWQEYAASDAVSKLLKLVALTSQVRRGGKEVDVPVSEVVPGDIVILNAGDVIPGDALLLEAHDLFVDEAALTGESFPAEKQPGTAPADASIAERRNALFMGTHVVSGNGTAVTVLTGPDTEFGQISQRLRTAPPLTDFERGVRRFGYFLLETTLVLVLIIFAANVYLHRPVLDSLMFSLALAVGLTPQLLPAIVSVNLAHGAREMGKRQVIVKRLSSIENIGSMDVFCSDKTGTLTMGKPELHSALDVTGQPSPAVLADACLNARFQTGFDNPIDSAITAAAPADLPSATRLDEVPYDFIRKRLSILVRIGESARLITKGDFARVLDVCTIARRPDGSSTPMADLRDAIQAQFQQLSEQGFRVLGLAVREIAGKTDIDKTDEQEMTFAGFLVFADPPKPDAAETIERLRKLGVSLKVITGDNAVVARSVCRGLGTADPVVLRGAEMHALTEAALVQRVPNTDIFAEVEPNHKERIILALKKAGHVVGYMGDGINDAPALHAADVGISVAGAVDVAQEAAAVVLLKHDLNVLVDGIREGRTTFANTLKYLFMATSANFGNMFSMAGASLLLPFLPLLPEQILLTNLLTDIPEMAISTDCVDPEWITRPHRWDINFIRRFMLVFGPVSSFFDFLTFGTLMLVFHASAPLFRTGWFVESVVSAVMVVLVVRTKRSILATRPGPWLLGATLASAAVACLLPWTPLAGILGFAAPSPLLMAIVVGIVALYVVAAEIAKRFFYRWASF